MSYTAGVLLLIAGVAIITGATLQVLQYRRGQHIITRGQLHSRLLTAVLLLVIIVLIFVGVVYQWSGPLPELTFWMVLFGLAILVILLAMRDLRQVEKQRHVQQAEIYRAIQDLQDMQEKSARESEK